LTSLTYDQAYYEQHKAAGLDYLWHDFWQKSYARMVSEATLQATYVKPFVVDFGCACGSILAGFRETGLYERILGIDVSEFMVDLGRKHFALGDSICAGSCAEIRLPRESVSLVHSMQVMEHIHEREITAILAEFLRILRPGGRAFLVLDAIKNGESAEIYQYDPTHLNIQPTLYWSTMFEKAGLRADFESYDRYARSRHGPFEGGAANYFQTYPAWSTWILIKP